MTGSITRFALSMAASAAALGLTGCSSDEKAEVEKIDQELASKKARDPVIQTALEGQIIVDPGLAGQANEHSVRPPNQPNADTLPLPPGGLAEPGASQTPPGLATEQARISEASFSGCQLNVTYSAGYAAKLPVDLPLFPKGRVVEAAGSDTTACRLRAVTYTVNSPATEIIGYYKDVAKKAGYRVGDKASGQDHLVSGQRAADGGAFYAIIKSERGATTVDLVANNGQ